MFPIDFSNPWIAAAGQAKRRANGWLTLVCVCLVAVGSIYGGRWLFMQTHVQTIALFYLLALGPFIAASLIAIFAVEGRPWPASGGGAPVKAIVGLLGGLVAFGIALGLSQAVGVLKPVTSAGIGAVAIAWSLGLMLFQCGAEEMLFRAWLQPVLGCHWGPWVGVVVTAAVFSLLHLISLPFSLLGVVNIALAGLIFGLLALRTGGLLAPFLAHFAWNYAEANIFGLTPNPGHDVFGSVLDFDLVGPAWLGGAADGLNQSLLATVALGLWLVAIVLIAPKRAVA